MWPAAVSTIFCNIASRSDASVMMADSSPMSQMSFA
jgi:hypothetical protein